MKDDRRKALSWKILLLGNQVFLLKNTNDLRQGSHKPEMKDSPWAARFTAIERS
jgi:hypothetical protein